jgi:hypothetical protein
VTISVETVVEIGALVGALCGGLIWAFKALVVSKNTQIRELTEDRDVWRALALGQIGHGSER